MLYYTILYYTILYINYAVQKKENVRTPLHLEPGTPLSSERFLRRLHVVLIYVVAPFISVVPTKLQRLTLQRQLAHKVLNILIFYGQL